MYGLIGYPLGHSFSAQYFTEKFLREGLDECYKLFPIKDINSLSELVDCNKTLNGLNVTIPYKQAVIPFLDNISDDASEIGAVNVIRISRSESAEREFLSGYNTDWKGFIESLDSMLHPDVKKALILGSGGASKAVVYGLKKRGIRSLIVSRTKNNGDITYDDIDKTIMSEHLLIVNTTPLGMFPKTEACPDIPYHLLTSNHICYDLIYNPEQTEFMRKSAAMGAEVKNGLEMLHIQAELSWKIWNAHSE